MGAESVDGVTDLLIAGVRVRMVATDDRNMLHMAEADGYEPDSLATWAGIVRVGRTAVDVGAYTGLYSIIAALKGANVVALEPMPAQYWRLGINLALNKARARTIQAAASDAEGEAILHHNPNVSLTTGASLVPGNEHHREHIKIQCITIDSLVLTDVAAMKIDVERHELAVLRGAMQTIERCRPTMLIETLDADMRCAVSRALPNYEAAHILDKRNTLFIPK